MGRKKKKRRESKPARKTGENSNESSDATRAREDDACYLIESSDLLGRYIIASRDLEAGEVIMRDRAMVAGPCQEAGPICIGCYADINLRNDRSYARCGKCGWPLCGKRCPGYGKRLGHSPSECEALAASPVKTEGLDVIETCFYAITPFRLLLVMKSDPDSCKIISGMETHTEARKRNRDLWKANEELAVKKIRNVFGMSSATPEEIHFACGALEINAFEVVLPSAKQPIRAMYPNAFLFSHDCTPNTCHSNGDEFELIVKTTVPVVGKAPLTISYAYTLQPTFKRRKHLSGTKFFECSCLRCRDPTELGTFCGAVKCFRCRTGLLLPRSPLEESSEWACSSGRCERFRISASDVIALNERLSDELDAILGNDIPGYENFLLKYRDTIHENHYQSLSALHSLSQLYGKIDGYLINELTEKQLSRKIEICRRLLKIFDKLEPGFSKQRGLLLYELQASLMVLLRRKFEERTVTKKEMKRRIREVNDCLEECCRIFLHEPSTSSEGGIAMAARDALSNISDWNSTLDIIWN